MKSTPTTYELFNQAAPDHPTLACVIRCLLIYHLLPATLVVMEILCPGVTHGDKLCACRAFIAPYFEICPVLVLWLQCMDCETPKNTMHDSAGHTSVSLSPLRIRSENDVLSLRRAAPTVRILGALLPGLPAGFLACEVHICRHFGSTKTPETDSC